MGKARAFFFVCAGLLFLALAYHLGARNATAQAPGSDIQDVAVLAGVLNDGGTIPLPTYRDGTAASESECQWTVSMNDVRDGAICCGVHNHCFTQGRQVRVYNDVYPEFSARANFMIIAVRNNLPTPAKQESFGSVKARYR